MAQSKGGSASDIEWVGERWDRTPFITEHRLGELGNEEDALNENDSLHPTSLLNQILRDSVPKIKHIFLPSTW